MNNDQKIMEDLLLTTKGVCDLYLHGATNPIRRMSTRHLTVRWAKVWTCSSANLR